MEQDQAKPAIAISNPRRSILQYGNTQIHFNIGLWWWPLVMGWGNRLEAIGQKLGAKP